MATVPCPAAVRPLAAVLALLCWLAAAGALHAQRVTLAGTVVDGSSGAPLAGSLVEVEQRSVLTDPQGRFALGELEPGRYAVRVSQLGYDTLSTVLEVREGSGAVRLELAPDPVVLEEIRVVGDRFRARRNAVPYSVRAFERRDLVTTPARDALDFVTTRFGLVPTRCPGRLAVDDCARVRGRAQPVAVFIDDAPIIGGLSFLQLYRPQDLYLIEVFGGGGHVRVYTNWYMERVARGRVRPTPVLVF